MDTSPQASPNAVPSGEAPSRLSQVGSSVTSKPMLGSKPKLGGGGAFAKPTLGLKSSSNASQVQTNQLEHVPVAQETGKASQEPQINAAMSMESKAKPASDAGSAVSKPLSFLERARLARGKQPEAAE